MIFNEPPRKIWLQYHGDADPSDYPDSTGPESSDVTWCWEPIFDHDIEYVRAEHIADLESQLAKYKRTLANCVFERDTLKAQLAECQRERDALRESVQDFVDAWNNDGMSEPSEVNYETAVTRGIKLLAATKENDGE